MLVVGGPVRKLFLRATAGVGEARGESKTYEVLTQRSEACCRQRKLGVEGRTSCPLAAVLGGRANVDMSLLVKDRTEEFDPGSD